jgi:hypothetical protein
MNPATRLIARGQVAESAQPADPVADVVRAICRGRAGKIEVRWTGSKRVSVCFEAPTQAEASKLVQEISARRELAPLQIDFCVLVK